MASERQDWHVRYPELFDREKRLLFGLGYQLDTTALASGLVHFIGRSMTDPRRTIVIRYPEGYPSFAPTVLSPLDNVPPLVRHHSVPDGNLCCFGFGKERWRADKTGLDAVQEAEALIAEYGGTVPIPEDDVVPEPRISAHNLHTADAAAILIPEPFGDMGIEVLRRYTDATLIVTKEQNSYRGVLSELKVGVQNVRASLPLLEHLQWMSKGQRRNVLFRVLDDSPPLFESFTDMKKWLSAAGLARALAPKGETWVLLVFPDEGRTRHEERPAWLGLLVTNGASGHTIRCYTVTGDDRLMRTPFGKALSNRRVVVVGCGSLGSFVAVALAQEGVGYLALVDSDIHEPGNSVRHQVGIPSFGQSKAEALAKRIHSLIPSCRVRCILQSVGHLERHGNDFYEAFGPADMIIDTTGSHATTHYLNRLCVELARPLLVVSVTNGAWSGEVFRYSPGQSGCWLCWYGSFGSVPPPGAPQEDLIFAPGCSQLTFVGGVADIMTVAGLAVRMSTEYLTRGYVSGRDYVRWIGRVSEDGWGPSVTCHDVPKQDGCICG